jgi:hypothetical protein
MRSIAVEEWELHYCATLKFGLAGRDILRLSFGLTSRDKKPINSTRSVDIGM